MNRFLGSLLISKYFTSQQTNFFSVYFGCLSQPSLWGIFKS